MYFLLLASQLVVLRLLRFGQLVPLLPEDLVDGGGLLQSALLLNLRPHLLHEEHESIQGFLDVDAFLRSPGARAPGSTLGRDLPTVSCEGVGVDGQADGWWLWGRRGPGSARLRGAGTSWGALVDGGGGCRRQWRPSTARTANPHGPARWGELSARTGWTVVAPERKREVKFSFV